ncbi:hypothetical protein BGX27_006414 [Mortierella sp. AM989]|nr:hypothetical protein BGX27_006414 [Mortierella sp. AM989]
MSNNNSSPTSPTNSSSRPMQAYQQYMQQQQQQQQQSPQSHQQQHPQNQHNQYQQHQQQQQQQQQPAQNLAVWSPSVPNYATAPSVASAPSSGQLNISGPLDLKSNGVQPILPPIKDAHPPPPRSNTPSRNTSLRRHPSQNSIPHQRSTGTLNQSFNNYNGTPHVDIEVARQSQQNHYPYQDNLGSDQHQPPFSPYGRNQPSTPGSMSTFGGAHSNEYFDNKAASPSDPVSLRTVASSPNLQRSNSRINYSSPLLRSQSRSGSSSPSSPSNSPLKRSTSILKNGSKDAPYLSGAKNFHGTSNLESLNHTWEPASPSPAVSASTSPVLTGSHSSISKFGSASNLRALVTAAATAASAPPSPLKSQESSEATMASLSEEPSSQGATSGSDGAQSAQPSHQEPKDTETIHLLARDSGNYKVPVPPSPVTSPRVGPSSGGAVNNAFGFLNLDPTLQRSTSRRRMAPPVQVQSGQPPQQLQTPQSLLSPQGLASPISPSRRYPFQRWENPTEAAGTEHEQGQGQDQQEDGDYEDEGVNDDTDGDGLSGPEDQSERRRRHQRQKSGTEDGVDKTSFTPARSAPQPPNFNGSAIPKSREAEIAHIMYIQQQQALFLQEKAMNPPLRTKGSNGNLSGGFSDGPKPRRKLSHHRKQISVISEPKLVSSTSHIKTVPIVRPADQSDNDNDDAGAKSEHTSGGEGIKKTVRKMRRAVRHAANGVFHDDDSDREEAVGSKSDTEKKGGLKQLKALKSKLAKKLHRPGQGGNPSLRHGEANENGGEGSRGPVQFFSEDNLRARYLAQEQQGGNSFAAMGASLRRSNTTRDSTAGSAPLFPGRNVGEGDKQEYDSTEEKEVQQGDSPQAPQEADEDAAAKEKKAKFTSRTFDKDEMMEVNDGTGESFFLPRWDLDPRADELDSSKSVVSVQYSKKLERSASSSTTTSTMASKPIASITERLQGSTVVEEETENSEQRDALSIGSSTPTPTKDPATEPVTESEKPAHAEDSLPQTDAEGLHSTVAESLGDASEANNAASICSSSGLNSRASVLSETSSNVSSVGGIVVAQVLTRQSSMRRNFKRPTKDGHSKVNTHDQSISGETAKGLDSDPQQDLTNLGLGISLPLPNSEAQQELSERAPKEPAQQQGVQGDEKQLPALPQEGFQQESASSEANPLDSAIVRPLSPIRGGTVNSGRSSSITSVPSLISGPLIPPTNNSTLGLPLETQNKQESSTKAGFERELSLKKTGLRNLSIGSFTLPQAPSSPLPSPSLSANPAPPTTPFPGVLLRQGSHLAERASVRSMYADSIYDCYDYDSASEYDSQIGADHLRVSREGSFSSALISDQDHDRTIPLPTVNERVVEPETKEDGTNITTTAATLDEAGTQTLAVSLSSNSEENMAINVSIATPAATAAAMTAEVCSQPGGLYQNIKVPSIPSQGSDVSKNDATLDYKEEEHHVHYEDIPKAVPYRMSIMTTVPVDPVGVAASLSIPSRPPRHPMRRSRHGSINTLNSDFTSDSWLSSSARDTRDDLSGWDVDLEQDGELARRPSTASSLSRFSHSGRSERTMSAITDSRIVEEKEHEGEEKLENSQIENDLLNRRGSEGFSALDGNKSEMARTQWYSDRKRETWGSIQTSSSDSASSSSSSRSSHFYFNGKSPSPSPTEETAPATGAF